MPLAGRRRSWRFRPINPDEPQPAYKVKRLTQDEMRALRHAGLTDEQIDAVSLVGMGTDEVNELMLQGLRSTRTSGPSRYEGAIHQMYEQQSAVLTCCGWRPLIERIHARMLVPVGMEPTNTAGQRSGFRFAAVRH